MGARTENGWKSPFGVALMQIGKLAEAIDHPGQALRLGPDFAPPHGRVRDALLLAEEPQAAIGQHQQALRAQPELRLEPNREQPAGHTKSL